MSLTEKAREAQYTNILRKIKSGKVATEKEMGFVEQYEREKKETTAAQTPGATSNPLDVSRPIVASFFSVTATTICNWAEKGMPKEARGLYNLKECFKWWQKNIDGGGNDEMDGHKTRYWKEQADMKELESAQIKGNLIARENVIREWAWRAAELRTNLTALSSRLPQKVDGLDIHQSRAVIKKECADVLRTYCRDGRFTPAPKDPAKGAAKRCRKKPTKKPTASRKRK